LAILLAFQGKGSFECRGTLEKDKGGDGRRTAKPLAAIDFLWGK
jgi:hypothetical protein